MDWLDWVLLVARVVIVFFALLITVMILIWFERKTIADMQTRVGPMRAGPRGVLITLTDEGRALIDRVTEAHMANEARLLEGLSEADRDRLAGLLRELALTLPPR